MKLYFYYSLFFIALANVANAQTTVVSGRVTNKTDGSPIAGAIVSILAFKDSTIIAKVITNTQGSYSLNVSGLDSFIVQASSLNYDIFYATLQAKGTAQALTNISLQPKGVELNAVVVQSKVANVVLKGDTSQFAASNYKLNPDATIEDLIKKMPGVQIGRDGSVTAQGEAVKKVTIDGKDFFGDDATAALKNLPADVVDKIQVFDRLSDQARLTGVDDGNSVKAINVVTKAGIKNGQLGRLYAGIGTNNTYNVGGNSSFFKNKRRLSLVAGFNNINQQNFAGQDLLGITGPTNNRGGGQGGGRPGGGAGSEFTIGQVNGISRTEAFGVNYNNELSKKITASGSYFYNKSNNQNEANTKIELFLRGDTNLFSRQNSQSVTNSTNHRFNLRLEYTIDSANSIFIIPSVSIQQSDSKLRSTFYSYFGEAGKQIVYDTLNTNANTNTADRKGYNIRNNILYRHLFSKKGRSISIGITHTLTQNISETISDGNLKYFSNGILTKDSLQNQFFDNLTNGYVLANTLSYTEPLSKKAQLQFDYNPSVQKNKADQKTFRYDGTKYSKLDTLLTNDFDNTIITQNAGITYRFVPEKEALLQVGINLQTSKLESNRIYPKPSEVNQRFANVLPNFIWRKKFSKKDNIRVFYRTNVGFPSIGQLQDVVNLSSATRVTTGNPALKQSYTHFLGSRYSFTNSKTNRNYFAGIFLQTTANFISNATFVPRTDSTIQQGILVKKGIQLIKPLNFDGYRNARIIFNYNMPISYLKSIISYNASVAYIRTPGLSNQKNIITDNFVYLAGVSITSNVSQYIDYTLSYNSNINQTKSTGSKVNNAFNQAISLQANLLHKKGWFVQNDINYIANRGLSAGFNQQFCLWNAGIGKRFLPKNIAEIKLSVYDILRQNQSINRVVDENRITDSQNIVLQQYFMLTFTYSLKNFGNPTKSASGDKEQKRN